MTLSVLNQKKLEKLKDNPVVLQYLLYIGTSIFLGICLKLKIFEYIFAIPVPLMNRFVNNTSYSSPIDHNLVFSTSATILATVFTIIFVLLTLFVQISDFSVSDDILQSKETKNLFRLYFAAIILSLIMLETNFQYPILILTLTFVCIFSLYPFLINLSDKLAYDVGIGKLTEKNNSAN